MKKKALRNIFHKPEQEATSALAALEKVSAQRKHMKKARVVHVHINEYVNV